MSIEVLWRRYAASWSLDEHARPDELRACVADDVVYADPQGVVEGADALSAYMAAFQSSVPGGAFEIAGLLHHHDRSLARWRLRGADGAVVQTGTSAAMHNPDGRLHTISGFFDDTVEGPADHAGQAAL